MIAANKEWALTELIRTLLQTAELGPVTKSTFAEDRQALLRRPHHIHRGTQGRRTHHHRHGEAGNREGGREGICPYLFNIPCCAALVHHDHDDDVAVVVMMCMCVCVYVCMYVCVCVYVYVYVLADAEHVDGPPPCRRPRPTRSSWR